MGRETEHTSENRLDPEAIRARLPGHDIRVYSTLVSTNAEARRLLRDNEIVPPGLIIASRQTGGRGRRGNRWWSSAGALTCSFVVTCGPHDSPGPASPGRPELLTGFAAGLATREAVAHFVLSPVRLKWPNDVLLDGKKVAGILCENLGEQVVVGIGVNANNPVSSGPSGLADQAVAICEHTAAPIPLAELVGRIGQRLTLWIPRVRPDSNWTAEYDRHHLLAGRLVRVESGDGLYCGLCRGIDGVGRLLVDEAATGPIAISAGHVSHWHPPEPPDQC